MGIACLAERAPCFPSRICSISCRTNSPACVESDFPSRSSSPARSMVSCPGRAKWFRYQRSLVVGLVCNTLIKPGIVAFLGVRRARGLNTLPQRLRQYLLDQPETTDDLHVVSVILKDGRVFEDVAISHCSLVAAVRGHSHVPFAAQDIAELRVTHRRWGFGQEIKPS